MAKSQEETELAGVRLSHPDKVLYPDQGITKLALAEYYVAVAPVMLPYAARRPITLVRCPTGQQKKCFYQRHAGSGVPAQLKQVDIEGFAESGAYLYIEDAPGLVALVQMGVLEMHPWNARVDRPDRPDQIIFDLDPGEGLGFADIVAGALTLREVLDGLGLTSFVKTSGGKGLHIMVPIERRYEWPEVKSFAKAVGERLAAAAPERFLIRMSKAERRGRIFVDYLRNDPTSTAVAPYSTRSRPGAPVSLPIGWDEVTPALDPGAYTLETVPALVAARATDPWSAYEASRQRLPQL